MIVALGAVSGVLVVLPNQAQARGFCNSPGEEHQEQHHANSCTPAGGHPEEAPGHE